MFKEADCALLLNNYMNNIIHTNHWHEYFCIGEGLGKYFFETSV